MDLAFSQTWCHLWLLLSCVCLHGDDDMFRQSFLTVCRDVLLVGLGDDTFKGQMLHLCSLTLLSGECLKCLFK